jgi:hypothetical protein
MVLYHKSQIRKLPKPVQDYMRRKFNLPAEYLGILRCLKQDGANGGEEPGTSINIFSPIRAREHRLVIRSDEDLKRYPEMVLFKGRIDNRGGVYVADRRGPAWGPMARHS